MGRAGVEPTRPSRAKLRNGGAAAAAVMVCSLPATKRFYNELSVRAKKTTGRHSWPAGEILSRHRTGPAESARRFPVIEVVENLAEKCVGSSVVCGTPVLCTVGWRRRSIGTLVPRLCI